MRVDLICLSDGQPAPFWPLGETRVVPATVAAVASAALAATADGSPAPQGSPAPLPPRSPADSSPATRHSPLAAVLFWDATLGTPNPDRVSALLAGPGDVWHAGLALGMAGLPRLIDFVDPVWRFNRDPRPDIVAVSWRLSLRACLARVGVLRALGGPDATFDSLAGAALELGHRWIAGGAMMRHVAGLWTTDDGPRPTADGRQTTNDGRLLVTDLLNTDLLTTIPPADEFRFIRRRYGRVWAAWAGLRAVRHGASPMAAFQALRAAPSSISHATPRTGLHPVEGNSSAALATRSASEDADSASPGPLTTDLLTTDLLNTAPPAPQRLTVTVLIPTLDRYPHLFVLLDHLRAQSVPPLEIIVVDQTAAGERDEAWPERFADLPLRVITRDTAGQCSSRNAGLAVARGDGVLFLDDDDEIPPDLIARHLDYMERFGVDASCGVAEELGAGPLPAAFRLVRESDVFPTNNALLRRDALAGAGLFDLAYERGERADGDLGMRLYLTGKALGLNPGAAVLHLHAPRGGLRQHRARVVTRGGSRGSLRRRHLLAPTEGYLWSRYFTPRQAREALLIRTVGTLRGDGPLARRLLRVSLMTVLLPDTWRQNRARLAQGRAMLDHFPSIPAYEPTAAEELIPT